MEEKNTLQQLAISRTSSWRQAYLCQSESAIRSIQSYVMSWACIAASGLGSLVLIDDVKADNSSRMYSEVSTAILLDLFKVD